MFQKFLNWFRFNLGSMILAFVLALTVWIVATLEDNPFVTAEFSEAITIEVIGLESSYLITNNYTEAVTASVRAQQDHWRTLSADHLTATIDLSGLSPGTHLVDVTVSIEAAQVRLVSVNPDQIRVVIEEFREQTFTPRITIEGQPAIGYLVGFGKSEPEEIVVHGPRSQVDLIEEVRATVSIEGKRDSFRGEVTLVALDNEGNTIRDITITPDSVTVEVPLTQIAGYKYISIIPRSTGRPAPGYYVSNITMTPAQIILRGEPEALDNMQPYIETSIDVTGLTNDTVFDITLNLPPGVTVIDNEGIEALVSIAVQAGSRAMVVPIEIIGLGEGLFAELIPEDIEVILSGPLPILDALIAGESVTVILDLTNLPLGSYQLEPTVEVLNIEILIESFFPIVIEIAIIEDTSPESK